MDNPYPGPSDLVGRDDDLRVLAAFLVTVADPGGALTVVGDAGVGKSALVGAVGRERLVLDLSCRFRDGAYWVVTDRWQRFTDTPVTPETLADLSAHCDEFLVHGVDVEGKQSGIDEALVALLGEHSPLPTTYAGGVRILDDLERIRVAGRGRVDVTVGSALDLFGGRLPFREAVAWHRRCQTEEAP